MSVCVRASLYEVCTFTQVGVCVLQLCKSDSIHLLCRRYGCAITWSVCVHNHTFFVNAVFLSATDEGREGFSTVGSIDWFHTDWNLTFTADVCKAAKHMHACMCTHTHTLRLTGQSTQPKLCCAALAYRNSVSLVFFKMSLHTVSMHVCETEWSWRSRRGSIMSNFSPHLKVDVFPSSSSHSSQIACV